MVVVVVVVMVYVRRRRRRCLFPLLPSPERLEPHIGPFLSLDSTDACSSLLRKIEDIFIKFH